MDSEGWYFCSETRLKQLKRLSKYLAPCWQFNQWCWQPARRDWGSKGRRSYGRRREVRFQFINFGLWHKKKVGVATYIADSSHKSFQEGLCLLVQLFSIGVRERLTQSIDVTVLCDQGSILYQSCSHSSLVFNMPKWTVQHYKAKICCILVPHQEVSLKFMQAGSHYHHQ